MRRTCTGLVREIASCGPPMGPSDEARLVRDLAEKTADALDDLDVRLRKIEERQEVMPGTPEKMLVRAETLPDIDDDEEQPQEITSAVDEGTHGESADEPAPAPAVAPFDAEVGMTLPEVYCCCGRVYSAHSAFLSHTTVGCSGFLPRPSESPDRDARIVELEREVKDERKDWSELCLAIAHLFDPECAHATWDDIAEAFDPYACLLAEKKRKESLLLRAEAAEKALAESESSVELLTQNFHAAVDERNKIRAWLCENGLDAQYLKTCDVPGCPKAAAEEPHAEPPSEPCPRCNGDPCPQCGGRGRVYGFRPSEEATDDVK